MRTSTLLSRSIITSIIALSTASFIHAAPPTLPPTTVSPSIPNGGYFQQYFNNMVNGGNCPTNQVLVGFNANPSTFGRRNCNSVISMVAPILSSVTAWAWEWVVGFDPVTGVPSYGPVWSWIENGWSVSYAGNVGIGTNTPSQKLDIIGNVKVDGICIGGSCKTSWADIGGIGGGAPNYITKYASPTSITSSMIYDNGTRIGIGTNIPNGRVNISSSLDNGLRLTKTTASNWNYIEFAGTASRKHWIGTDLNNNFSIGADSATSNLLIGWFNNVGIKTSNPTATLHVTGTAIITWGVSSSAFVYSSDRNLKTNIAPLDNSLEKILSLSGYSFDWKSDSRKDIGLIAQEVEKVYPDLVHTDATTGMKAVEYGNLVAPLIEAVKSQQREIESLKSRIEKLESAQ